MYYSKIRIDPTNPEIAYQGGAPFFKTVDGGKTWRQVQGLAHSDHHAIWINPRDGNHLLVGNDGGLDVSYDQGATWEFINWSRYIAWWARWKPPTPKCTIPGRTAVRSYDGTPTSLPRAPKIEEDSAVT